VVRKTLAKNVANLTIDRFKATNFNKKENSKKRQAKPGNDESARDSAFLQP